MPENTRTSLYTENFFSFCAEKLCMHTDGRSFAGSHGTNIHVINLYLGVNLLNHYY